MDAEQHYFGSIEAETLCFSNLVGLTLGLASRHRRQWRDCPPPCLTTQKPRQERPSRRSDFYPGIARRLRLIRMNLKYVAPQVEESLQNGEDNRPCSGFAKRWRGVRVIIARRVPRKPPPIQLPPPRNCLLHACRKNTFGRFPRDQIGRGSALLQLANLVFRKSSGHALLHNPDTPLAQCLFSEIRARLRSSKGPKRSHLLGGQPIPSAEA